MSTKTEYYLGMNNLMMILEQERKHWLLHTDKKKTSQDKRTGDMYVGTVDNKGSNIVIETNKTGRRFNIIEHISCADEEMNNVINPGIASFPYENALDGLLIQRIISSQYTIDSNKLHYKIKFSNCKKVIIPMSCGGNVYPFEWIKTTTTPVLEILDPVLGTTTTTKSCGMLNDEQQLSGCSYFYPLTESLQPLPLTNLGNNQYESSVVNTDAYIGYPLFWFNCNDLIQVNRVTFDNMNDSYFAVGNDGLGLNNFIHIYTGFEDNLTPSGDDLSSYKICCTSDETFDDDSSDFSKPISATITLINTDTSVSYDYDVIASSDAEFKMTMCRSVGWTYVNENTYEVDLENFRLLENYALTPVFDINVTLKDVTTIDTTDSGAAGIFANTGMSWNTNTIDNQYIEGLFEFDGLPEGILERLNSGEGLFIYAIHDTPEAGSATGKQTAAIILDPGDIAEYPENEDATAYNLGRAYLISNDPAIYENNATSEHPKPERTVARICDIPNSIAKLTNIRGLSPTIVVDKKYVRSECSYEEDDKDRLYNTLSNKWVRPIHKNIEGSRIIDIIDTEDNDFVFRNSSSLEQIDLINHNDFRKKINLNPLVNAEDVTLSSIASAGENYNVDDTGIIIVGGVSFEYIVESVTPSGGVLRATVYPSDQEVGDDIYINLSNFDIPVGSNIGETIAYGTSPTGSSQGTGLKIKLLINNYADIITKPGEIFDGLFALVTNADGLYLYSYHINPESENEPKLGWWRSDVKISDYDNSNINIKDGYLSLTESYINSILPIVREVPVALNSNGKRPTSIEACVTSSCINIIDKQYTPLQNNDDTHSVDINKFTCDGINIATATTKTFESIIESIKDKLTFDSYLLWRWVSIADTSNKDFEYMLCRRSFNNLISNNETSFLPENELRYNKYVHTNSGTIVTWNIDEIGQMVWVYNPASVVLEKYSINEYKKLNINYVNSTWENIDVIVSNQNETIPIVDNRHQLLWNIATNNQYQTNYTPTTEDKIYQQPEYIQILNIGKDVRTINQTLNPIGSWNLIFPRSQQYHLRSTTQEADIPVIEMGIVRTDNLHSDSIFYDRNNNDVNEQTIAIDQSSLGVKLKVYDKNTSLWVNA